MKAQGIVYKIGFIVVLSVDLSPVFGRIDGIIIHDVTNFYFVCKVLTTVCFSEHFHSFEVESSSNTDVVSYFDIYDHTPLHMYHVDNTSFITLKYHLIENI